VDRFSLELSNRSTNSHELFRKRVRTGAERLF